MRLLLLLKVASALTSGALPPSALYKPSQTVDRALSWAAALGVFAKLVKRRPAAAVVAGLLTQPLAAGITRDLLRTPSLAEPASLLPDANSRIVDTDPLEGVRIVAYEGRGTVTVHASHGFGSTSESFQELLEALSLQSNVASVIAHDHPGFGLVISGCCDDAYLPILTEFRALSESPLDRYLSIDANITRPHLLTWNVSEHTPAIPLIALGMTLMGLPTWLSIGVDWGIR